MAAWGVGRLLGPQLMVAGGGHPTNQWFGMYYAGQVGKRLPVPIFQSIESFVIFGILILIERRLPRRPTGFILSATMGLWGLSRFAEEHLWLSDTSHVGSLLVQAAGIALCVSGIVLMIVLWRRQQRAIESGNATDGDAHSAPEESAQGPTGDTAQVPTGDSAQDPAGVTAEDPAEDPAGISFR